MSESQARYKVGRPSSNVMPDRVFEFIREYKRLNDGLSPTHREIMEGLDISSTSVVSYYLDNLVKRGKIVLPDDRQGIKIVGGRWTYAG